MRTLYLRNVPDDVADRLERMAKVEGLSVNAVAIRELAEASRRIDNVALLESLLIGTSRWRRFWRILMSPDPGDDRR